MLLRKLPLNHTQNGLNVAFYLQARHVASSTACWGQCDPSNSDETCVY